ncbi:caffeine-induced death protein 2-domain-containing protein [Gloeopeniophorella convolvens]|nr:caffeine-induced death protein 2-domain-containing protein [Gloeopeniophorella convolvens]
MSPRTQVLGSLAVQSPSQASQLVQVTPATCHNLSLFKELLREYRKLDDAVNMRINRTTAQFRDRDRLGTGGKGSIQDQACAHLWQELVDNWRRRAEIIDYCVKVTDEAQIGKLGSADGGARAPQSQGSAVSDEVKRRQVRNELTVEKIVRQRSLDAFTSRCRYFEPPRSDGEARRWWDETRGDFRGRSVAGLPRALYWTTVRARWAGRRWPAVASGGTCRICSMTQFTRRLGVTRSRTPRSAALLSIAATMYPKAFALVLPLYVASTWAGPTTTQQPGHCP